MNYELILEKGNYALIKRGEQIKEYAVVNGLNKASGNGAYTCYCHIFSSCNQAEILACALDNFRIKTEENYISHCRIEELAVKFKDGLIEDDEVTAMEYFNEECKMTAEEKQWFGIEQK